MHGCVEHPGDFVLTRGDYLRYNDKRAALMGIVQAMHITKRMLFVGFSLNDENFQRIADDVRKAVRGSGAGRVRSKFGTALTLQSDRLFRELWENDLDWVMFGTEQSEAEKKDLATAARRHEIFLDYVAANSTSTSRHLLDDRFSDLLSEPERELKNALVALEFNVSGAAKSAPAWKRAQSLLKELPGGRHSPSHERRIVPMRIATWNLMRPTSADGIRTKRVLDANRGVDADVWIFTETHQDFGPGPE